MLKKLHLSACVGLLCLLLPPAVVLSVEYYDRGTLIETTETCLDCHEDMAASLDGSAHRLTRSEDGGAVAVGCVGCHDGWEVHLEDPSTETIADLELYSLMDQAAVCGSCHQNPHQSALYSTDPHNRTDVRCLSCHRIHDNHNRALVKDDEDNYCTACHTTVAAQFKRRSTHPLESGNVRCIDCHRLGYVGDNLYAVGVDWTCQECHTDLAGPYVYEHKPVYEHLTAGGGCNECHEPHGAAADRLLTQPGNGVCMQCHGVPPMHRVAHSGLGSQLACVDCHTQIHGSNDNPLYLDPDLGAKLFPDCYQSGCHDNYR